MRGGTGQGGDFEVLDVWIPLPDGCRLAARIWLPREAMSVPVPAILEYLPYRKRDGTAVRDAEMHSYFASHGYACLRVDIRGTGDSKGTYDDEYSLQEHADALAVIEWITRQPWSDGVVGMMGISWGGFNSLQIAALRPPALRAIVTVCSTDDRYNDDCHYQEGTVVGDDMLPWAASLLAILATPADASTLEDHEDFLDVWRARIDSIEPPAHLWLAHQVRDEYWRHGSVCEDYSAVEAATLVVGGWADGYRNAALRLVGNLTCPRRGIIGPWAHMYPNTGFPGPTIDFFDECLRWWDHWLRGRQSGAMDTPLLRTWINEWNDPSQDRTVHRGRWVGLDSWTDRAEKVLHLDGHELGSHRSANRASIVLASAQIAFEAGAWCAYGHPSDLPPDQRSQDATWTVFDCEPLETALQVFGFPVFEAALSSTRPEATVGVRLCDVAPDGTSLLVSERALNLCYHVGAESPAELDPTSPVTVAIPLNALGHTFAAGHRLRLALSSTYFPRTWPLPEEPVLSLQTGLLSTLTLPLLPATAVPLELAQAPDPLFRLTADRPLDQSYYREVTRPSSDGGETRLTVVSDGGLQVMDTDTLHGAEGRDTYSIRIDDPLSATVECHRSYTVGRPERPAKVQVETTMTADMESFHVTTTIEAFLGDERVHHRDTQRRIPRHRLEPQPRAQSRG